MLPKLRLLVLLAALVPAGSAQAVFHLIEIEQVIGGVGGDTLSQAVQLKMRTTSQTVLNGTVRVVARDATGFGAIVISTLGGVPAIPSVACREILLATDAFAARTTPAAVRDFAMLPIPAGYLPAGSLTFENAAGTLIYWRVSWGGAAYTGPGTTTLDNGDGNVNPPFAGPLPSNGTQALRYTPACPGTASDNSLQYAVTAGAAVFTNSIPNSFTINALAASAVPVLPGWGWLALASALGAAGIALVRRRRA